MDILIYIIIIVVLVFAQKAYRWIRFKTRYPLLSENLPEGILSKGDKVIFRKNVEMEFVGISHYDSIYYIFMPENSVTPVSYQKEEVKDRVDTVLGEFGIKWKRIK